MQDTVLLQVGNGEELWEDEQKLWGVERIGGIDTLRGRCRFSLQVGYGEELWENEQKLWGVERIGGIDTLRGRCRVSFPRSTSTPRSTPSSRWDLKIVACVDIVHRGGVRPSVSRKTVSLARREWAIHRYTETSGGR
jgi:hypothetical protein